MHTYTLIVEAFEDLPPDTSSSSMNASLLRSLKNLLPVSNAFHLDQTNVSKIVDQDDLEGQNGAHDKSFIKPRRFSFGRLIRYLRVCMYVYMHVCMVKLFYNKSYTCLLPLKYEYSYLLMKTYVCLCIYCIYACQV